MSKAAVHLWIALLSAVVAQAAMLCPPGSTPTVYNAQEACVLTTGDEQPSQYVLTNVVMSGSRGQFSAYVPDGVVPLFFLREGDMSFDITDTSAVPRSFYAASLQLFGLAGLPHQEKFSYASAGFGESSISLSVSCPLFEECTGEFSGYAYFTPTPVLRVGISAMTMASLELYQVSATPEPGTLTLMALSFCSLAIIARSRPLARPRRRIR